MGLQTINFERMRLQPGDRLLDLGCGEGRHALSAYILHNLDAVGIDLSEEDLKTTLERFEEFAEPDNNNKSLSISVADGTALPFEDGCFDKIICSEVLEHIPDYLGVIKEISRVLKVGGVAGISVPSYLPEKICWMLSDAYHAMPGGHIRIFNAGELKNDVENAGFIAFDKHRAHSLHVPYWWLKCMFWREEGEAEAKIVALYHKMLVWDLMQQPWITTWIDRLLNPLLGKSVVMYFVKTAQGNAP